MAFISRNVTVIWYYGTLAHVDGRDWNSRLGTVF